MVDQVCVDVRNEAGVRRLTHGRGSLDDAALYNTGLRMTSTLETPLREACYSGMARVITRTGAISAACAAVVMLGLAGPAGAQTTPLPHAAAPSTTPPPAPVAQPPPADPGLGLAAAVFAKPAEVQAAQSAARAAQLNAVADKFAPTPVPSESKNPFVAEDGFGVTGKGVGFVTKF